MIIRLVFACFTGILMLSQTASAQVVAGLQLHNLVSRHIAPSVEIAGKDHFSFHLTVGVTPSRNIPGSGIARSLLLEDPESSNFGTTGSYVKVAVTPELRSYFGRRGAPAGFYVSFFGRYGYHNIVVPYSIPFNQTTISTESGVRIQTIGAGIGIGYQALFADERIALNIHLGGGAGYTPIRLQVIDESLTEEAYEALYQAFGEDLKVNLLPEKLPNFLTNNGLQVRVPIALPLFRAGIGLGFVIGR